MGQTPVVIDNRSGGDGLIAINAFLAANDDHVLLYASSGSFLSHPYTQEKLPYDFDKDFAPIACVSNTVFVVAVPASSPTPIRTVAEFLGAARANPQKFNLTGPAGLAGLTVDAFLKSENLKSAKVPYQDIVQSARDLAEDRIQFVLSSYAIMRPFSDTGRVRVIAIAGQQRTPLLKDVPTVIEAGFPGLAAETTVGVYGPHGMPQDLRRRIAADVMGTLSDPALVEKISNIGQDVRPGGPEELSATLRHQIANTAAVAKILGMARK